MAYFTILSILFFHDKFWGENRLIFLNLWTVKEKVLKNVNAWCEFVLHWTELSVQSCTGYDEYAMHTFASLTQIVSTFIHHDDDPQASFFIFILI